jgi:hypothetical protein
VSASSLFMVAMIRCGLHGQSLWMIFYTRLTGALVVAEIIDIRGLPLRGKFAGRLGTPRLFVRTLHFNLRFCNKSGSMRSLAKCDVNPTDLVVAFEYLVLLDDNLL